MCYYFGCFWWTIFWIKIRSLLGLYLRNKQIQLTGVTTRAAIAIKWQNLVTLIQNSAFILPCDLIRDELICVKEWQYHRLKRTMWLPCLKDENYFRCRVCHSISNVPKTPELADDGDWISWIKNYNFGGSKNDLNVKMCQDIRENLTLFFASIKFYYSASSFLQYSSVPQNNIHFWTFYPK